MFVFYQKHISDLRVIPAIAKSNRLDIFLEPRHQ